MKNPNANDQPVSANASAPVSGSASQTPCEILCKWAWGKVYLDIANRIGCPLLYNPARVEYRRALRVKKQLDAANRHTDHLTLEDVGLAPKQGVLL